MQKPLLIVETTIEQHPSTSDADSAVDLQELSSRQTSVVTMTHSMRATTCSGDDFDVIEFDSNATSTYTSTCPSPQVSGDAQMPPSMQTSFMDRIMARCKRLVWKRHTHKNVHFALQNNDQSSKNNKYIDYCKPFGIIKSFELLFGCAFITILSMPIFMKHQFIVADTERLVFVYIGSIYAVVVSSCLLIYNIFHPTYLLNDEAMKNICGKKLNCLKILECVHALCSMIVYFMIRHYCSRYYGSTGNLHGRMLVLMFIAWTLVSIYIIECFVQFGVSIHCGGTMKKEAHHALSEEYKISLRQAMRLA